MGTKTRWFAAALLLGSVQVLSAHEGEATLEERVAALEERYESLTYRRQGDRRGEVSTALFGNAYTRPVYRRMGRNTYVGGYMDFEYKSFDGKAFDTMRVHRLIPFIYADVTDQLKVATEIELEYGGPQNPKKEGELKVEFAMLDYEIREAFSFRGGLLLVPMGRVNALHDSPLQDLTDRPVVAGTIIPTTWTEAGAGFLGTFYPGETWRVDYEVYAVNGLAADKPAGATPETANLTEGFKKMRGYQKEDNNKNSAFVGRVGLSPFLGVEVGVSAYHGTYDRAGNLGIEIQAVDVALQRGALEILGEGATAYVETDPTRLTYTGGFAPNRMEGYYGQVNYHFGHDVLKEGSVFTGVVRWDDVNLAGRLGVGSTDMQRLTVGVNFRPVEDTVFKVDRQLNYEDGKQGGTENDGWNLGFASYF